MIFTYERDPLSRELEVQILLAAEDKGRPFVLLDDTVLYPEGGGQPADRGLLNGVAVLDVQKSAEGPRHYLAAPVKPGKARLELDWTRRFDYMQQHTAQHLLSALADDVFGWPTTSCHLQPGICDVELAVPKLSTAELEVLEAAVAAEVRAARQVAARRVNLDEYATLRVRTRGLPVDHHGDIRLVEIAGLDLATCGGTHLVSTAEIEMVKLLGTEPLRGGTRLFWIAGRRVAERLGRDQAILAELRSCLGAADHELASIAATKLEALKDSERRRRALETELAAAEARRLLADPTNPIEAHYPDAEASFLQPIARAFQNSENAGLLLLTAGTAPNIAFALVAGGRATADLKALGPEVAAALGGRGGGTGRIFQGKTSTLEGRAAALSALRARS